MWELTAIGTPYPGNSLGFRLEKNTFAVLKNIQSESQTKNKLFPLPCGPVLLRRIPFLLTAVERASSSVFRVHVHRGLNRNSSPPRPHAPVSRNQMADLRGPVRDGIVLHKRTRHACTRARRQYVFCIVRTHGRWRTINKLQIIKKKTDENIQLDGAVVRTKRTERLLP